MFGLNQSQLRNWENKFDIIKPQKNKKGNRLYTKEDIRQIGLIYNLVKERGMTIDGARKKIKENPDFVLDNFTLIESLSEVRRMLVEIRDELNSIPDFEEQKT